PVERDLLTDEAEQHRAARLPRAARQRVEPAVDPGQLLEARELRELRRELVRLHRRERVLVLELRDEELEELRLRHGLRGGRSRRDRGGTAGDGVDHARTLRPPMTVVGSIAFVGASSGATKPRGHGSSEPGAWPCPW